MQPSFDELPLYYKRVIAVTRSFKFTVFLQNRNCSKEILTIIIIPPWFQACIYWKKFVSWRHHFQPAIFSMIVSLFHRSTWRNPYVKETVFISQHFLQPSIIISGLWLIQEKVGEYVYFRKTIVALPIYSTELVKIFFLKSTAFNAQKHLQIPFFHGEPAWWNYLHFFKNFKTQCGV